MSSFTSEPWFEPVSDSKFWIVRRGFTYHITSKYSKDKIVIPFGFKTDFASVPQILWNIVPPWGRYGKAAVVHDWLYQHRSNPNQKWYQRMFCKERKRADDIFLGAMTVLNVRAWRKHPMYYAVRSFGWLGKVKNIDKEIAGNAS